MITRLMSLYWVSQKVNTFAGRWNHKYVADIQNKPRGRGGATLDLYLYGDMSWKKNCFYPAPEILPLNDAGSRKKSVKGMLQNTKIGLDNKPI